MLFSRKTRVCVHSGGFHPDEVFAVAVLSIYFKDQIEIIRTRDSEIIKTADFVVDVGGEYDFQKKKFDHHQVGGAGERINGVPYASFGLIWKHFGKDVTGSLEIAELFDREFVQFIDMIDNGVGELKPVFKDIYPYTVTGVVLSFLPTWKDGNNKIDERFNEAVSFAKDLLKREIKTLKDDFDGTEIVKKIYEQTKDKKLIILDRYYPWHEVLAKFPEPIFVVGPADDEGIPKTWKINAVRDSIYSFKNRKDLPANWAGKKDEELQRITGVSDAIFCHNKLFIAVAGSKDGALKLARLALKD